MLWIAMHLVEGRGDWSANCSLDARVRISDDGFCLSAVKLLHLISSKLLRFLLCHLQVFSLCLLLCSGVSVNAYFIYNGLVN